MKTGNIYRSDFIVSFKLGQFIDQNLHRPSLTAEVEHWVETQRPSIADWLRYSVKGYYALSWTRTMVSFTRADAAISIVLKLEDEADIAMFKLFFVDDGGNVVP